MEIADNDVDFDKIRSAVREINAMYGGKFEINEWRTFDGEFLKLVLTWKKALPLRRQVGRAG